MKESGIWAYAVGTVQQGLDTINFESSAAMAKKARTKSGERGLAVDGSLKSAIHTGDIDIQEWEWIIILMF